MTASSPEFRPGFHGYGRHRPRRRLVEVVEHTLQSCEVVVAIIGKSWLDCVDGNGARRLNNTRRLRAARVGRGARPTNPRHSCLVAHAGMPQRDELPTELEGLLRRNAVEISDARFSQGIEHLLQSLRKVLDIETESKPKAFTSAESDGGGSKDNPLRQLFLGARRMVLPIPSLVLTLTIKAYCSIAHPE